MAATYGMSGATAGARLGKSKEEGEKLLDNFFNGFPKVKEAIDWSKDFLKKNGYVEDFVGRRRHLPQINDPKYTVALADKREIFNPFFGCKSVENERYEILAWRAMLDDSIARSQAFREKEAAKQGKSYTSNGEMSNKAFEKLQKIAINADHYASFVAGRDPKDDWSKALWNPVVSDFAIISEIKKNNKGITAGQIDQAMQLKEKSPIYAEAKRIADKKNTETVAQHFEAVTGIPLPPVKVILTANTGRIAQAERQCFNARIQGSAASLTKMAMIDIFNSEELKKRDAHLIITVHDEVLVECPAMYADEVEQILPQIMIDAAKKGGDDVPQSCDPYNVSRWYIDEYAAMVNDEYKKLLAGDKKKNIAPLTKEEAVVRLTKDHCEVPEEALKSMILTGESSDF